MSKLIFVTGASGFLASHVVHQLLEDGQRVRATARSKKADALRKLYSSYPNLEIVEVADIAHSQFSEALVGVDAVIHTASPLPSAGLDADSLIKTAVEGTLNVLRQAEKVGVKKFVVTSSIAAVTGDPTIQGANLKPEHWTPITKESFAVSKDLDAFSAYKASKTLSERAVWDWAKAHPHVDVTTICPTFLFGPFPPLSLPIAPGDTTGLSTNNMVHSLFRRGGQHLLGFGFVDARDTARAHVGAALKAPENGGTQKRAILVSADGLDEGKLFDLIREKRPEVGKRLIEGKGTESRFDRYDIDFGYVEKVTGLKKADFHTTEQTFLDTIDALLAVEKEWKQQGYNVE